MEPETSFLELTARRSKVRELPVASRFQELEPSILDWSLSGSSCLERFTFPNPLGVTTLVSPKKSDFLSNNTLIMIPKLAGST